MTDDLDRIERRIDIAAPAERVWELAARPGWFINDGAISADGTGHEIEVDGDLAVVHDPVHGAFRIRTVRLDPPTYAAFRWTAGEAGGEPGGPSTLIEFWIEANAHGGVTLRVAESGFATFTDDDARRRARLEENTRGWEIELAAARALLEAQPAAR